MFIVNCLLVHSTERVLGLVVVLMVVGHSCDKEWQEVSSVSGSSEGFRRSNLCSYVQRPLKTTTFKLPNNSVHLQMLQW